jgi:hypothetical protein
MRINNKLDDESFGTNYDCRTGTDYRIRCYGDIAANLRNQYDGRLGKEQVK